MAWGTVIGMWQSWVQVKLVWYVHSEVRCFSDSRTGFKSKTFDTTTFVVMFIVYITQNTGAGEHTHTELHAVNNIDCNNKNSKKNAHLENRPRTKMPSTLECGHFSCTTCHLCLITCFFVVVFIPPDSTERQYLFSFEHFANVLRLYACACVSFVRIRYFTQRN